MKTKILWSGITGRTGQSSLQLAEESDYASIVAGICRSDCAYYNYDQLEEISEEFDIIVDFSHRDNLEQLITYAIKLNKPLIIGTAGLSKSQIEFVERSSWKIPIFMGGNFRFNVQKFIDDAVVYANSVNHDITLIETHYKTKKIPSETAKVIKSRVENDTNKTLKIQSFLKFDELINEWKVDNLICRVVGFNQLAHDVLKISSLMVDVPVDGIYDLSKLVSKV